MKVFIVLFLLLSSLFFNGADAAKHEKPFLAVFGNPGTHVVWGKYEPNLFWTACDFESDLPKFLAEVKKKLHPGQELILDIDCHGSDEDGLLYIQYEAFDYDFSYSCTVGELLNEIKDSGLNPNKMYLEACYSEICMESTLKREELGFNKVCPKGSLRGSYKYKSIDYPIYGVGTSPNISNLQYLQDRYHLQPYSHDLRNDIGKPVAAADHSSITLNGLIGLFDLLYTYGQ